MSKKKRNVNNNQKPSNNITNTTKPAALKVVGFDFDFSFKALFYSVNIKDFNNYTRNQREFVEKIFRIAYLVSKVKDKNFLEELITLGHCHILTTEKKDVVVNCIRKALEVQGEKNIDDYINKNLKIEEEPKNKKNGPSYSHKNWYQVGFEGPIRLIGTYDKEGSVFSVYLIDYHHKLYPDKKFNDMGKNTHNFCIKKTK